jgi:hypothetical protein
MPRSFDKKRFGLILIVAGAIALVVYSFLRLTQIFNDGNGVSGLFTYVLLSSALTLFVVAMLINFVAKSSEKAKPTYFLVLAVFSAWSILSSLINNDGSSVQFISRLVAYALLLGGSVSIYLGAKAENNPPVLGS